MQYANYRIWKTLKTLCSCKCLSPPPYLKFTLSPMYKNKTQRKKGKRKLTISTSWNSDHFYRADIFFIGQCHARYRATSHNVSSVQQIIEPLSGRYLPHRADTGLHFLRFSPTFFSGANYRALIGPISLLSGTFYFVFSSNSLPPWTFGTGYVETNNPHTCCLQRTHRLFLKKPGKINTPTTHKK